MIPGIIAGYPQAVPPMPPGGNPVLLSATTQVFTTASTSHNVTMPAVNAGDLIVVVFAPEVAYFATKPASWAEANYETYGSTLYQQVFHKIASGSEGGTNVNFSTTSACKAVAAVLRFQAGTFFPVAYLHTDYSVGSNSQPNPPLSAPPWGAADICWIAQFSQKDSSGSVSSYPYPDNHLTASCGPSKLGLCTLHTSGSSQEDPAAFTTSDANGWIASTISVLGTMGLTEYTGITWSQSSVYSGTTAANATNMRNNDEIVGENGNCTGTGTYYESTAFVRADLGSPKSVSVIVVGAGNIPGFGTTAAYLNGGLIQSSQDGVAWTTEMTVANTQDNYQRTVVCRLPSPVTARYWRVMYSNNYLGICTFQFFG